MHSPNSISPGLEVKDTREPRVADGESRSPGPGRARASAAQRPALSPQNPPSPLQSVQVRTRFRRAPELREPTGWAWGVGEGHPPQPRRTRPAPGVPPTSPAQAAPKRGQRRGGARGGPRFYLLPGSRPRVARLAFPAPSAAAAAAATRLKRPEAGSREPAGRGLRGQAAGVGGARAGRHAFPVPPTPDRCPAAHRVAGVRGARWRRTLRERTSGLPPGGPRGSRSAQSVSGTRKAAWARSQRRPRAGQAVSRYPLLLFLGLRPGLRREAPLWLSVLLLPTHSLKKSETHCDFIFVSNKKTEHSEAITPRGIHYLSQMFRPQKSRPAETWRSPADSQNCGSRPTPPGEPPSAGSSGQTRSG
ncbi:translation initiation factor IF-2-like [Lutra lutra]|uniref:translation initiation factor IF-2-like n=1 Tax=Lutra lutra TaxID=9657 RepID=UPI001FCFA4F1|nr:translation initiation factor IF-2-like [Lutra lutra]